jgi:hypothetical protein
MPAGPRVSPDAPSSGRLDAVQDAAGWRAVILVEGVSDQAAVETLAGRCGRDLAGEGVAVLPMGGATNIGHYLALLGPGGLNLALAGLCDAGEEHDFRRGLERAGFGPVTSRAALARQGFFVCVADLEDELIRSLGLASVEEVISSHGDLPSLRRFQQQPAQRGRAPEAQFRRFMGTRSGRKARYARLLSGALDVARVPGPLGQLLAHVG